MPAEFRDVRLPEDLCQDAERKYGERFGGLEQFLAHILQQLLCDDAKKMDQADQAVIAERLKDLGYI
jgi:hypothetical protein